MAESSRRSPIEVVEIDHEIRILAVHLFVVVLGPDHPGFPFLAVRTAKREQPFFQTIPLLLVVLGLDDASGFASLDVEKDAGIITSPGPGLGPRPVDVEVVDARRDGRPIPDGQLSGVDQPLVDTERAFHAFGAVVGNDKDDGVIPGLGEKTADFSVDKPVIIHDDVLITVSRLEQMVFGIGVFPEGMLDAVDADLDEHE